MQVNTLSALIKKKKGKWQLHYFSAFLSKTVKSVKFGLV